jgi:hypothetical protein
MELMEKNPEVSRIPAASPPKLKWELVELLESVGIVRRYDNSQSLVIPLALRGRPVCWSQIMGDRTSAVVVGQRLGATSSSFVSAALFIKLMLAKCSDAERMWGCAFAYDVSGTGRGSSCIFVRLREDRCSIDIVTVMRSHFEECEAVAQLEVHSIAELLGNNFSGPNDRKQLCPMCCSSDMFVRTGAVHAFYPQEVAASRDLQCSRYHHVTANDVNRGKSFTLGVDTLPLVYPGRMHDLQLPWRCIASGGIMSCASDECSSTLAHAVPDLHASSPPHLREVVANGAFAFDATLSDHARALEPEVKFQNAKFMDCSFFVLTGQVAAGDVIAAGCMPEFMRQLSMCATQDCSCDVTLGNGQRKTLHFSYKVGESISNSYFETPITHIFPADIGDAVQHPHAPRLPRFCAHDNVLVLFGPVRRGTKFIVFPGSSSNLQLCRLTPAFCQTDPTAASCWSQLQVHSGGLLVLKCASDARFVLSLQDQFSVVTGHEFELYEITSITLLRNDARSELFAADLQQLEQRAPSLPALPHWLMTPRDLVCFRIEDVSLYAELVRNRLLL